MLKIWGRKTSSNVRKILWCCVELNLEYDRIDWTGPFGGNDDPAYRKLNPNGLVPTIEDGDLVLWESNTILRYLTHKHSKGNLWPEDAGERGLAEMWMDWQLTELVNGMVPVFHGLIRKPPEERDMDVIAAARDDWAAKWRIMDDHLSRNTYVGGDSFTMADIPIGPIAYRWYELPIEREDFSHLQRWYDAICARPAFQKHCMTGLS